MHPVILQHLAGEAAVHRDDPHRLLAARLVRDRRRARVAALRQRVGRLVVAVGEAIADEAGAHRVRGAPPDPVRP